MKNLLRKISDIKKQIDSARPFPQGIESSLQERLRIEWTYNSNALEGNTLTFGETAFFLREGLTSEGKPLKDYLEAKNHAEAIDGLADIINGNREITESLIKQLHAVLMKDIEFTYARGADGNIVKKPMIPGKYKTQPNHVLTLSGKIHYYTDPVHVVSEMEGLIKWYRGSDKLDLIERAAVFHYKFVAIHPFDDGNGRLARLLMNLILMKEGYPPCIIKNAHRRKYLSVLDQIDKSQNVDGFVEFVAEELLKTLQTVLSIVEGREEVGVEVSGKLNREQREAMILETVGSFTLSIGQIFEKLPQIKRPTLKKDLHELVKVGKLNKKGVGKGVVYFV